MKLKSLGTSEEKKRTWRGMEGMSRKIQSVYTIKASFSKYPFYGAELFLKPLLNTSLIQVLFRREQFNRPEEIIVLGFLCDDIFVSLF